MVEIKEIEGVTRYRLKGNEVFSIPVESFPNHITNCFLVIDNDVTLIDLGMDGEKARGDLLKGWEVVNNKFKQKVRIEDVKNIVITHGHGDHFGMLMYEELRYDKIFIHKWDRNILTNFDQFIVDHMANVERFLIKTGASRRLRKEIIDDHRFFYKHFKFKLGDYDKVEAIEEGTEIINGYKVFHTPGHSSGEICLQVDGFLFLGDHILSETTPHQSPNMFAKGLGLSHYLRSLGKIADLTRANDLYGLPAHERPIYPVYKRAEEIEEFHKERLKAIIEICMKENTVAQIAVEYYKDLQPGIFGDPDHPVFNKFLAFQEIAAHIEYLFDNGRLERTNRVEHVRENAVPEFRIAGGAK